MSTHYVPRRHTQLSPLCPPDASCPRGLEKTQFEAMVQASRERSAMLGVRKPLALRKEIAVKSQKIKQLERRVRFLNKLCEAPSPSAANTPVTPPDSPTIFHFTLPSPGLQSPWEHFEYVHHHPERYKHTRRIEQVDFRLPHNFTNRVTYDRHSSVPVKCISLLPSLDQISQRLNKGLVSYRAGSSSPERAGRETNRLPSFLRTHSSRPLGGATPSDDQPSILSSSGLRPATPPGHIVILSPVFQYDPFPDLPPPSLDNGLVESQITQYLIPPSQPKSSLSPYNEPPPFTSEQSEEIREGITTTALERAQVAKDMFNKLSRRTCLPNAAACGIKARDDISLASPPGGVEEKQRRRTSAPAFVTVTQTGTHPILEKSGGF